MLRRYLFSLFVIVTAVSCGKHKAENETYIASAEKVISLANHDWAYSEPELSNKEGYQYITAPANVAAQTKATVSLPAIDDSNRTVKGEVNIEIAPSNFLAYTVFVTDPLPKSVAFAMMLNYHHEALANLADITSTLGGLVQNNWGGNLPVDSVLARIYSNADDCSQLNIIYFTTHGRFSANLFRQNDGSYRFDFRN